MKAGSFGQELTLAAEMLAEVENIVAKAGLNASSTGLLRLAQDLSQVRYQLRTMLPSTDPHGGNESLSARRNMDPMKIALRVLTAHANGAQPEPADLNAMERMYGEKSPRLGWDEFACEAIQRVLRDRAAARKSVAHGIR